MNLIESLFLLLSLLSGLRIFLNFFSWLALWQRKEYRLDRLKAHLQIKEGRRDFFSLLNLFSWQRKLPKFTLRVWVILVITLIFFARLFFLLLNFLVKFLLPFFGDQFSLSLFLSLLILHLATPSLIALGVFLSSSLVFLGNQFLLFLAAKKLEKSHPLVIGITGSFGKTATKEILAQVLGKKFKILKTQGNENTKLGIALRVIKDFVDQQIFICEMGAYKRGEIKEICQLVKPRIGILTGIDCQHQALFGSLVKIQKAKYELIEVLPKDGLACFNANNVYTRELAIKTKKVPVLLFGRGEKIILPSWAKIYQENAQAALKIAEFLGMKQEEVLEILRNLRPFSHCLTVRKGRKGAVLIDDSYNANPTGFLKILDFLAEEYPAKKKLVVTPGIIELGRASEEVHQKIGGKIREIGSELVLTNDNFQDELQKGYKRKIKVYEEEKLIDFLKRKLKRERVALFEGRISEKIIKACQLEPKIKKVNNKKIWEKFVLKHPQANFLHSFNWGRFHQRLGKKVIRLGIVEEKNLVGVASLVKEKARRGTYLACPAGPLLKNWQDETFPFLVSYLREIGRKERAVFIRVRPQLLDNPENRRRFSQEGFRPAPMHMHAENTWQLKLDSSPKELLKEMRKNTRYSIRKAKKMGVKVEKSQRLADINDFYRLQLKTARRQHFVPFSLSFLKEQFKVFSKDNQVILLKAIFEEKIIAMAFFLFYGKEAVYHYAAGDELARKIPASYLLIWEAIKEAKKRRIEIFNFWGIAPRDEPAHRFAGVTLFKKGFGGFRVDYLPAQDLPLSKFYFLTYFFESLRKIKRGL